MFPPDHTVKSEPGIRACLFSVQTSFHHQPEKGSFFKTSIEIYQCHMILRLSRKPFCVQNISFLYQLIPEISLTGISKE